MNLEHGKRLVQRARREGAEIREDSDGRVAIERPDGFPMALLAELRQHREAVSCALKDEAQFEDALRSFLPSLGASVVEVSTGRTGCLWGASRHGLIIAFGEGVPLLTLDPREVRMTALLGEGGPLAKLKGQGNDPDGVTSLMA